MNFIRVAIDDMHSGRETWRVRLLLCIPAFMAAAALAMARLP